MFWTVSTWPLHGHPFALVRTATRAMSHFYRIPGPPLIDLCSLAKRPLENMWIIVKIVKAPVLDRLLYFFFYSFDAVSM